MKLSKKLLSLLLCAVMVLGSVAVGGGGFAEVLDAFSVKASAAKVTSYSQGVIIEFGWYPQSKETNTLITDALTSSAGNTLGWNSYGYYSGTGEWDDGQMTPSDYMRYTDVMYGSTKYRGVVFDSYRPYYTGYRSTTSASTYQDDNDYTYGKTYWFKYEPLVWRVLDSSTGLVMCESIIDSQAYNNYIWYDTGSDEYYGNEAHTNYANDYYNSSIRKWLTEDFYATAFSESQQNKLLKYNCDNSCPWDSSFDSQNSSDKVFLLSYDEVKNTEYGFNSDEYEYDPARRAKGTDYAKCQGLYVCNDGNEYDGNSFWWLRSPDYTSSYACGVSSVGYSYGGYCLVYYTGGGVRPALKLNLSSDIFQSDVTETGTIVKTASAQTIDYRSIVTITATATAAGVPDDCKLAIYLGSQKVAEGDNKSVSYEYGEIKSDINYTVKVIDANGKVQKDSNGNELSKDGGKITCNAGFFKKLIAFFKGLFKSLPKVEVKP
ncbi:MAG: DUF6273 domain-containing protein [Clostridia bacterium]|nr:DUF6273 domain-containing protein [Clostridia bacterium]